MYYAFRRSNHSLITLFVDLVTPFTSHTLFTYAILMIIGNMDLPIQKSSAWPFQHVRYLRTPAMCFDGLIVTVSVAQVGHWSACGCWQVELCWSLEQRWMARVLHTIGRLKPRTHSLLTNTVTEGFFKCELSVESVRCSFVK